MFALTKCSEVLLLIPNRDLNRKSGGLMVNWLSLQINFIQQNLNSCSVQVQILHAAFRSFAITRISSNSPSRKQHLRLSAIGTTHNHHHRYHSQLISNQSSYSASLLVFWCFQGGLNTFNLHFSTLIFLFLSTTLNGNLSAGGEFESLHC